MSNIEIISRNPEETLKIAKKFAEYLKTGDVIILSGDLGAGKTKFVEGFLSAFGLQDEISSPTFNIVNEYHSKNTSIYHFDVYRLEDEDEFYEIGGEEYFEKGISLIEWGEIVKNALPKEYIKITIIKDDIDENKRFLKFKAYNSEKYEDLLEKFMERNEH